MKALRKLLTLISIICFYSISFSQVTFENPIHDYGNVKKGKKFYSEFIFTNNTDEKVYLLRATTPASTDSASEGTFSAFDVYASSPVVEPGQQGSIQAYFEVEKPGKFQALIRVYLSNSLEPVLLGVKGKIKKIDDSPDIPCYSFNSSSKKSGEVVELPTFNAVIKNEYGETVYGATVMFEKNGVLRNVAYSASDGSISALIYEGNYNITVIAPGHDTLNTTLYIPAEAGSSTLPKTFILKKGAGILLSVDDYANNNIVFLIDISSSMNDSEKIDKLKESMKLLISKLRERDYVTIVTYADKADMKLPPVPCSQANKSKIYSIIDELVAEGKTATDKGLELAYALCDRALIKDGNNQIILATDGEFELTEKETKIIAEYSHIKLSTVGFGCDQKSINNLQDIALKGKGRFINADEAQKPDEILLEEIKKNSKR